MLRTIKSKFIFFSILLILLSVGIPSFFLIRQFQSNFKERSEIYLNASIDMILFNLKIRMNDKTALDIQGLLDNMTKSNNVHHIRIFDTDGKILYSSEKDEFNKNINLVAPRHIDPDFNEILGRQINLIEDHHAYTAFQAVNNDPECHSCHGNTEPVIAYIDVDTHLTTSERNFNTGSRHFVYLGIVVTGILGIGLLVIFNSLIKKPLFLMTNAINKLEKGDFNLQLPIKRDDEFGAINKHFNRMVHELDNSRKQIEELHLEQLQRADKMVTLGEIAAAMAHDINNHSAVIMTRADYLQMRSESDPKMAEFNEELKVINDQVHKISKTTGYILKNAKRISSQFSYFDLTKLVSSVIKNFEPLFKKKNIKIEYIEYDKEVYINGNIEQIEQLLMNLLNNAADAVLENGIVRVEVKRENNDTISLIVSDNGNGISAEDQEKIFSPFFTTKANEKGTGLGLYIIKNICKNHNAEIVCRSKLNEGTSFILTFKDEKDVS